MQNGAFRSAAENSEIKKTNHGACQSLDFSLAPDPLKESGYESLLLD